MALYENYERREQGVNDCLKSIGMTKIEEARDLCASVGVDPYKIVKETQPIAFEDAGWAYTLGCAVAIKKGAKTAEEAAKYIGEGLQAFCVPGSVAANRQVGLGHGNLGSMLLDEETECFAPYRKSLGTRQKFTIS